MIGQSPPIPEPDAGTQSSDSGRLPTSEPSAGTETAHKEIGGRGGLEPTRYGDWEKNGRCIDF
ncbi:MULTISPECIES: DUF1674 domain-containing protein [unclassified Pseudoxanthomonas]|uniref:DUF1674 domain-containing protein n=1 Tax=unclassified Pseudoxanthomonas TaxID=2645906 RepID=UPI003078713B